jgi:hypothetical protein
MQGRALLAVVFASVIIVLYVAVRFHAFRFGVAAVIALVHDILITAGLIALAQYAGVFGDVKINLAMLAAFLTILGYSLNDTIVVFDRIRENMGRLGKKMADAEVIDLSINQTLSRTVLTSFTTFVVVFVLFLFGGSVLHGLALTLMIGVVVGTYSSMFIASPILLDWEPLFASNPKVPASARSAALLHMLLAPVTVFLGITAGVVRSAQAGVVSRWVVIALVCPAIAFGIAEFFSARGIRRGSRTALYVFGALAVLALGAYFMGRGPSGLGGIGGTVSLIAFAAYWLAPLSAFKRTQDSG